MGQVQALRRMSPAECKRRLKIELAKLRPNCLFELKDVEDVKTGRRLRTRYFIAINGITRNTWNVIELNSSIRKLIARGKSFGTGQQITIAGNDILRVLTEAE